MYTIVFSNVPKIKGGLTSVLSTTGPGNGNTYILVKIKYTNILPLGTLMIAGINTKSHRFKNAQQIPIRGVASY